MSATEAARPTSLGPGSQLLARINPEAVGLREAPFTFVYLVVAFGLWLSPGTEHRGWLGVSTIAVLVIQLVASFGRWRQWPRPAQYAPPLAQMACLVGLDYASSVNPSFLTVMLFLPVVSLALQPSTIGVALGTLSTAAITLEAAGALPGRLADDPLLTLSAGVVTMCALLVGAGVYAVTQRLRDRTDALLALQAEQDATLRTLAEQRDRLTDLTAQLEESRDLFRSMVDAATELLVLATDDAGQILIASPGAERVLACSPQLLIGSSVVDLADPTELRAEARARGLDDSPGTLLRALVGAALHGEPERHEWAFRRPGGETVPVAVLVTRRRRIDEPEAEGYLFVAADLTERKEGERLQDEFVGLVSHELRTPLSSILGYLELLKADATALDPADAGYLGVIERNAQRLLRLVNDLLLSVQVVAGTFSLSPERADAAEITRRSVEALQPAAVAQRVTVAAQLLDAVPLTTDPQRFGQVVENLLANAIKFTPAGGTVTVTVGPEPVGDRSGVRLVVGDNGPGMTAEEIARATARFFRSESARRQRVHGLGLGLSIVDAIVQAHAGTLAIASEPGVGTVITVVVPDLTGGDVSTDGLVVPR